jgi:hypothetical protein
MTSCDAHDGAADSLDSLRALAPDANRAERVRVSCRTQLGRNRRRAARTALITGFAWRVLAPVVVGAFCVLYVVMLLATTLRLEGVLH